MKNSPFICRAGIVMLLLLLCPLFTGAEELVSYQLEESEHVELIPDEIIPRPLRQVRYTQPYASRAHGEKPVLLTLTGLDEPLTQKYIAQYSTSRNWLNTILKRSEPYMAFIRREVERRGLPQELIYLPVIESAYNASAVSRQGATGLWQFMRNSIGPYNMRVTEWVDERRDFWKSTIGALDKLEAEYKRIGSWELTLSAYNAGLGTVLNAMKKHPGADYWELCRLKAFKNETIQYIPRLLAVSYVLSNLRRYGIEAAWPEDPQWTRIAVGRSVDLNLVAEHAGLKGADLKEANRELLYNITPPDPDYHIKVPSVHVQAITAVLEDPELTLLEYYFHAIRSGDTLSGIAQRYGVSENQIRSHNPGLRERYLSIGQRLIIPALKDVAGAPRKEGSPQAASLSEGNATPVTVEYTGTHLVKRGETLWSIAITYKTDPETLARLNGMTLKDTLREGATLKTPVSQ